MPIAEWIQLGIGITTVLGFIVTIISLKKDNRKSNEETITKTIENKVHEVQELMNLRNRVDMLEQRFELKNNELLNNTKEIKREFNDMKKDLSDLKTLITKMVEKISNHIENEG